MRCADNSSGEVIGLAQLAQDSVKVVAALHFEALPDDVLPTMGSAFLEQYYRWVFQCPEQVVIGAFLDGRLVGFCQLSMVPVRIMDILKVGPSSLIRVLRLLFSNTRIFLKGLLLTSKRPREFDGQPEISFIAVRPGHQGRGVGKRLVQEANRCALAHGATEVVTKTSNPSAKALYERHANAHVVLSQKIGRQQYWYLRWSPDSSRRKFHAPTSPAR